MGLRAQTNDYGAPKGVCYDLCTNNYGEADGVCDEVYNMEYNRSMRWLLLLQWRWVYVDQKEMERKKIGHVWQMYPYDLNLQFGYAQPYMEMIRWK